MYSQLNCCAHACRVFCLQVPTDFLGGFQAGDSQEFVNAWNQALDRRLPPPPQLPALARNHEGDLFQEFEGIYGQEPGPTGLPPVLDGQ